MHRLAQPAVIAALLTPFDEEGRVELEVLREHVERLVDEGVDGVMPCGTTGEGPLLDDDEIASVTAAAVEAAGERVPVLAHVGRPDTAGTIRLTRRALGSGAAAVSAVVPYYYALGDAQVVGHYRAVIDAADGNAVYAYTIPACTGNELSVEAVRILARDGLAGVKDSTKSLDRHREYLGLGIAVLMGSDGMVFEALAAGAAGCVSALANVRPDLLVRLKEAVLEGRVDEARAAQEELSSLRRALAQAPPLVGLKEAVAETLPAYPASVRAPLG